MILAADDKAVYKDSDKTAFPDYPDEKPTKSALINWLDQWTADLKSQDERMDERLRRAARRRHPPRYFPDPSRLPLRRVECDTVSRLAKSPSGSPSLAQDQLEPSLQPCPLAPNFFTTEYCIGHSSSPSAEDSIQTRRNNT